MDQPLAEVERACQCLVQSRIGLRIDIDLGHRQLDGVLLEARQAWPFRSRNARPVHTEGLEALLGSPLGQVGVITLAGQYQRRKQRDALPLVVAQQSGGNRGRALRLDGDVTVGAVLCTHLYVEQAQEVVDLGQRGDRALSPAATRALLDGHGRRDSKDGIHIRPRGRLYELPCVGIQRLEVAALPFVEEDVEGKCRLTRARYARDDRELVSRYLNIDVLKVVLPCVVNHDRVSIVTAAATSIACLWLGNTERRARDRISPGLSSRRVFCQGLLVSRQRLSGVGTIMGGHSFGRTGADDLTTPITTLWSQIDDPVRCPDDVEV